MLFLVVCIGSLFVHSNLFTDEFIVPKWIVAIGAGLLMLILFAYRIWQKKCISPNSMTYGGIIISFCCFVEAMYGLLQYTGLSTSPSIYPVTGSFENPAGFAACLCAGLPFVVGLAQRCGNRAVRLAAWTMVAVSVTAVVLSESRAGMVSIGAMAAVWLWQRLRGRYRAGRIVLLAACAALFAGCYWMKKDSADGRLLIWRCSLDMAREAPLTGGGPGTFAAHYMDSQARYFAQHGEQNRFALLADNVKHPFNEYLNVLLDYGIVGLLVLAGATAWLARCYRKHPDGEKRTAAYALLGIGTFSLFSYPFTYPFTWVVTLLSAAWIAREPLRRLLDRRGVARVAAAMLLVGSIAGLYALAERTRAELAWNRAARMAMAGEYGQSLPAYEQLAGRFAGNPYFLYNHVAVLQAAHRYEESLRVARQCRTLWADYDLELLMAENLRQLGQTDEAAQRYRHAARMCPSRFLPLYNLLQLCQETGDRAQAAAVAEEMLAKPVKVRTPAVRMMRRAAEKMLDEKAK